MFENREQCKVPQVTGHRPCEHERVDVTADTIFNGRGMKMYELRPAGSADLDAINRVVEAALMGWALPERVKRLSLPIYRYSAVDLVHLETMVAEDAQGKIIGVAAWEDADPVDSPADRTALLLHGIYVDPVCHRQGVGRRLFEAAELAARAGRYDGLLVKAQQDAIGFFLSMGMHPLAVANPLRDYANRLWKTCAGSGTGS